MSFINTSNDFPDFKRFFYDQVRSRNDFFEEPNPKVMWTLHRYTLQNGFL